MVSQKARVPVLITVTFFMLATGDVAVTITVSIAVAVTAAVNATRTVRI